MRALLPADRLVYARVFAVVLVALYAALGAPIVAPVAWLCALTALGTAAYAYVLQRGRARPFSLAEYPRAALVADLVAATLGMIAASPNPRSVGMVVVICVGAITTVRFKRLGLVLAAAAFVVGRTVSEIIRIAIGDATPASQLIMDVLVGALTLGLVAIVVEAYRGEQRRAERALELARSLENVALDISGETDPARVLQRLPLVARSVVATEAAALVVRRADEFAMIAAAGAFEQLVGLRSPVASGLVGDVMTARTTVATDDYAAHATAPAPAKALGLNAVAGVPIFVHGTIAAVLLVARAARARFSAEELRALEGLAAHAAIALANARELEQSRRLETIARDVRHAPPDAVYARVGLEVHELFACEWVVVAEIDGHGPRIVSAHGLAADLPRGHVEPGPVLERVLSAGELVVVPDLLARADELRAPRTALGRRAVDAALRAVMAAPIVIEGRVRGAIVAGTVDPNRAFYEVERRGLLAFAETAAVVVRAADLHAERERRIERLSVLNTLAWELAQARDIARAAQLAHEACGRLVARDAFYVARYDEDARAFHVVFKDENGSVEVADSVATAGDGTLVPLGSGPASRVILTGRPHVTLGSGATPDGTTGIDEGSARAGSAVHVPLTIAGKNVGVLSVRSRGPAAYDAEDTEVLRSVANLVASAFANVEHLERARDLYLASVRALAAAVDARDPYTRSHSARVAALARLIAEELDLPPDEIRRVQLGALLHDIGKIGIPDAILNKPAALTAEEWTIMRTHSSLGASILEAVEPLRDLVPIIRSHHERWDGDGYPERLRGEQIPLGAAICAVADAFEVIVSKRAYKAAHTVHQAISELVRCRGTQFSPAVVDAFLRVIERDRQQGTQWLRRVRNIQHEDIEDVPGPGEVLERYAARSHAHARQLAILQRLASEFTAVLDIDDLAARLLRIVCEAMGHDHAFLATVSPAQDALTVVAAVGPSVKYVGSDLPRDHGISWAVVERGVLQNVRDVRTDPRYVGPDEIRSSLIVPLNMGDERVGVLGVESTREAAFGHDDEDLLTAVSHQIAAAIRVARLHADVQAAATTDALTGLANRRAFFDRLSLELERASDAAPVSVAVIDVDLLKETNDRFGHGAGDEAIATIARLLRTGVRPNDLVARLGGDEFGIVLAGATQLLAERALRRVTSAITSAASAAGTPLPTISWGIASAVAPSSVDAVVDAADAAMYRHKRRGRGSRTTATA